MSRPLWPPPAPVDELLNRAMLAEGAYLTDGTTLFESAGPRGGMVELVDCRTDERWIETPFRAAHLRLVRAPARDDVCPDWPPV